MLLEKKEAKLNKLINKKTRKEKRMKNMQIIEEAARKGKGLKIAWSIKRIGKQQTQALKDENSGMTTCRDQLLKIIEVPQTDKRCLDTIEIPDITVEEVAFTLDPSYILRIFGNADINKMIENREEGEMHMLINLFICENEG